MLFPFGSVRSYALAFFAGYFCYCADGYPEVMVHFAQRGEEGLGIDHGFVGASLHLQVFLRFLDLKQRTGEQHAWVKAICPECRHSALFVHLHAIGGHGCQQCEVGVCNLFAPPAMGVAPVSFPICHLEEYLFKFCIMSLFIGNAFEHTSEFRVVPGAFPTHGNLSAYLLLLLKR